MEGLSDGDDSLGASRNSVYVRDERMEEEGRVANEKILSSCKHCKSEILLESAIKCEEEGDEEQRVLSLAEQFIAAMPDRIKVNTHTLKSA